MGMSKKIKRCVHFPSECHSDAKMRHIESKQKHEP